MSENQEIKNKVGVFVDESNVYYVQKTLGWKIDYKLFKEYLNQFGDITVCNLYLSYQQKSVGQNKFIKKLKKYGYKIYAKEIKKIKNMGGFIYKGNLDVELSSDMILQKELFDCVILISGDSDFEYILKLLKRENKQIIVISTGVHISWELIKITNKYIDLKKIKEQIEYNQQNPQINPEGF